MGFRWNVFNGLEGKGKYRQFSKEVKLRQPEMEALLASLGDCPRQGGLRGLVARSIPLSYLFIKTHLFVANIQEGAREVMNNLGVLPKALRANPICSGYSVGMNAIVVHSFELGNAPVGISDRTI